jgi:HAD superfamily hydrolase (TIGR01484 family)
MARTLAPLADLPPDLAAEVRVVFTDIDDTLTTEGRLTAAAFAAMEALDAAGVAVVPVTGRPAGWCDHVARMWPVAGVVGENGAFYYRYDAAARRFLRRYVLDEAARAALQDRLRSLGEHILAAVPGCAIASDQAFRIHDLAVDFCEDVAPLPRAEVDRIAALFAEAGATAKISSIHVNGWFGDWDKVTMIRAFATEVLDLDLDDPADNRRAVYVGDSPNDCPAFAAFSGSVGVANVRAFAGRLDPPPAWVTRAEGGAGFAELAARLLAARGRPG